MNIARTIITMLLKSHTDALNSKILAIFYDLSVSVRETKPVGEKHSFLI